MSDIDVADLITWCERDPFPGLSSRRRRGVRVTTAAAAALGLSLCGRSVAGATSHSSANHLTTHVDRPAATGTTEAVAASDSGVGSMWGEAPDSPPVGAGGSDVRAGPPLSA